MDEIFYQSDALGDMMAQSVNCYNMRLRVWHLARRWWAVTLSKLFTPLLFCHQAE